jgi:N-methylhydantoinase A/oxoprolinase/acetone carboxylase beta subunit
VTGDPGANRRMGRATGGTPGSNVGPSVGSRFGPSVGSDTGGTFTDLVTDDGRIAKVPSTPDDPGRAVRTGLGHLLGADAGRAVLAHGTTVATNAVLERSGGPVALVTTAGFADVIEIGRQDRPSLYDTAVDRPEPLVVRAHRFEVTERLGADGSVVVPLDDTSVVAVVDQLVALRAAGAVAAVAVCLLHADVNADHERAVGAAVRAAGLDVTCSHEVSPEFREYERTATTVVNAYLRPVCGPYVSSLADAAASLWVMTSAGGLTDAAGAADVPARLLLSGPAGGVRAAAAVAAANDIATAVTFDMGGTSTDVCLIVDGVPAPAAERSVDGLPVRLASLDVHTIGAGGGSVAGIDAGGALVVGPRSAGAVPGPACYGLGGIEPTVTDANVVLGRIPATAALPGLGVLDATAAAAALADAGVDAAGVVAVVNAAMEQALREVTVERGVDPAEVAMVAFGGAGGLHCCELAEALGITTVVIPERAGVFSAVGVLTAPRQVDLVRSWPSPLDHSGLHDELQDLGRRAAAMAAPNAGDATAQDGDTAQHGDTAERDDAVQVVVTTSLDCRYAGQSHELTVPTVAAFHDEHERRNGYRRQYAAVEVVALRATAAIASPVSLSDLGSAGTDGGRGAAVPIRVSTVGPAVVTEPDCTIWIPAGWRADPGRAGALVLTAVPMVEAPIDDVPTDDAPADDAPADDADGGGLS